MQKENHSERLEISFSGKIKEELARQWSEARHCQIAELAAIISMCGKVAIDSRENYSIKVRTENVSVARKYFTLLRKTFNIDTENSVARNKSNGSVYYTVIIKKHESAIKILQATKLMDGAGEISEEFSVSRNLLLQQSCCKRAFIRGTFLAAGSMSNPAKGYHLEIVCVSGKKAAQLKSVIHAFEIEAKVVIRKKAHVVYLKEGGQIADFLNIMEAPVALMEFENIRILKDMRNTVNRKVNCETANIHKTVSAAVKQVEDITYIKNTMGLDELPEGLEEIAKVRLQYPEATLKELGDLLTVPLGKSGVNHRLRKLSSMAEKLRENKEDNYD